MRHEKFIDFLHVAVEDIDQALFNFLMDAERAGRPGADRNTVLTQIAMRMFMSNAQGAAADYVRELVKDNLNGELFWV